MKEFDVTFENLGKLKQELEFANMEWTLRKIEADIQKTGNLHMLSEQIRTMKRKQKTLATNILKNKRREALKGLLRDENKRRRLKVHSKSLVTNRKRLQNNILEEEDFKPLLEAFPCWCVTTYAVSDSLPLKPGLFDVAIIDEASQCDIASCFPILFRAKKQLLSVMTNSCPTCHFWKKLKNNHS